MEPHCNFIKLFFADASVRVISTVLWGLGGGRDCWIVRLWIYFSGPIITHLFTDMLRGHQRCPVGPLAFAVSLHRRIVCSDPDILTSLCSLAWFIRIPTGHVLQCFLSR